MYGNKRYVLKNGLKRSKRIYYKLKWWLGGGNLLIFRFPFSTRIWEWGIADFVRRLIGVGNLPPVLLTLITQKNAAVLCWRERLSPVSTYLSTLGTLDVPTNDGNGSRTTRWQPSLWRRPLYKQSRGPVFKVMADHCSAWPWRVICTSCTL